MSKITITPAPQEASSLHPLSILALGYIKGVTDADNRAWEGFLSRLADLDPGEIATVELIIPRNGKFHRKFFALLAVGFDAWEPNRTHKTHKGIPMEKSRDQFREDIIILAGFYDQTFDLHGKMLLRAKSISFANMDNAEFEQLYSATVTVLLREVLITYKDRAELDRVVEKIIGFTNDL